MSADGFGGQFYHTETACCENHQVVQKTPIWVIKAPLGVLGGDGGWGIGPISHSYVSIEDPIANPQTPQLFGKHPRPFGESGSPFTGPGFINQEVGRDPAQAMSIERKMVCPADRDRMSRQGNTEQPYRFGSLNCHDWANGKSR